MATTTSGGATIERQEAAESFVADDVSIDVHRTRIDKLVANALVITLGVVVSEEFAESLAERLAPEENHLAQALCLDALYESLSVRIAVWRPRWNLDELDSVVAKDFFELCGELCVAVDDHVSRATKEAVVEGRKVKSGLFHEMVVGMRRRTNDVNAPSFEFDDEECVDGDDTLGSPNLSREEVRGS